MPDRPATTSRKPRPPGRKRRVAGWLLLAIGVLITGAWGASRWWWLSCCYSKALIEIGGGSIEVRYGGSTVSFQCLWRHVDELLLEEQLWQRVALLSQSMDGGQRADLGALEYVSFTEGSPRGRFIAVWITLWPFALASLLGGGFLLWSGRRARRRAMTNVCLKCGYDLRGLAAGGQCPECGNRAQATE